MKKTFRGIRISLLLAVLLMSLIITSSNTCSAQRLLGLRTNVKLNYDADAAANVVIPLGGETGINVNISARMEGLLAPFWERFLSGVSLNVELRVKETQEWVTATVQPNVVSPEISSNWIAEEAVVKIAFSEDAPANVPVKIIIEMISSAPIARIQGVTREAEITFTPSYLPIIDVNPQQTFIEVAPGQIARFDIDLENLGNAKTQFLFEVTDVPEGWTAIMPAKVIVDSKLTAVSNEKTIQLQVTPPYDFGYHNDEKVISFKVSGRYFAETGLAEQVAEIPQIQVKVRSRGFSTPGFEAAMILVIIPFIYLLIRKRKNE